LRQLYSNAQSYRHKKTESISILSSGWAKQQRRKRPSPRKNYLPEWFAPKQNQTLQPILVTGFCDNLLAGSGIEPIILI